MDQAISTRDAEKMVIEILRHQSKPKQHRIVHDTDCDFANVIVGKEVDGVVVLAYHPEIEPRPYRCSCGANPELINGFPQ